MDFQNNANEAVINFYGDIVNERFFKTDVCPTDISDFLESVGDSKPLNIHINSCGGSVFAGITIYNRLKAHKGIKTVYIDGLAASIASIIALAGDKIIIEPSAYYMIHKPCSCVCGNADEIRKEAEELDKIQNTLTDIYMLFSKCERKEIEDYINAETWFTGTEVVEKFNFQLSEEKTNAVNYLCTDKLKGCKNVPESIKNAFNNFKNKTVPPYTENRTESNDFELLKLQKYIYENI